jgi:hypothetical protein
MTLPSESPMYRLYRKMDGELVLQYFVLENVFDDLSAEGEWVDIETVNETSQKGISSSNAS